MGSRTRESEKYKRYNDRRCSGRDLSRNMEIGIGIFTEYVAQKLGEQTGEIVMTVSDRKDVVSDPIGGECWVENGLHISEKAIVGRTYFVRNPDGIWAIFIRIRGCLTEKKRSGMLLKEQRKAVWIFMCRQNII